MLSLVRGPRYSPTVSSYAISGTVLTRPVRKGEVSMPNSEAASQVGSAISLRPCNAIPGTGIAAVYWHSERWYLPTRVLCDVRY
eukprot:3940321-Rhodomonas_salina.2